MIDKLTVAASFAVKIGCGLATISLAARWLDAGGLVVFLQFGFFVAIGNLVATGGVVYGVVRLVAANRDDVRGSILSSALHLSLMIGGTISLVLILFSGGISFFLVGDRQWAWLVMALAPLMMLAGQGQIIGAFLTGAGRATSNMIMQSCVLIFATLASLFALWVANAAVGILVFAIGLGLQAPAALWLLIRTGSYTSGMLLSRSTVWQADLLRYSAAFLVTAITMPLLLFVLRDDYRSAFGVVALAGWLAANRLSDVNSQFLGMYMGQIYLRAATTNALQSKRHQWISCYGYHLMIVACLMSGVAIVFFMAPTFWVRLGLGEQMVPALAIIGAYIFGDILRSWPSINQHSLLASGWVKAHVGHEVAAAVCFAALFLWGKSIWGELAPAAAYIIANLIVGAAGIVLLAWLHRRAAKQHLLTAATSN